MGSLIFWSVFSVFALYLVYSAFQVVPESNVRIVERFGKYRSTLKPGIGFIIPFLDKIKVSGITTYDKDPSDPEGARTRMRYLALDGNIPTLEIMMDPPEIDAISSDNAIVRPDSILYFRIVDAVKAVYEVEDLGLATYKLLETTLRQEIGTMDSDAIIIGREKIGGAVRVALEEAASAWGVQITRVEIEEIRFSDEITKALSDQREAELLGRAKVAEAEREREAIVIKAEADKKAVVLNAEAKFEEEKLEAEADFLKASRVLEGQAKGTEALARALEKNPNAVVALEALKAQIDVAEAIGKSENTLIIPEETAGLFGAIKSITKVLDIKVNKESTK
jgi:regulator of protease activity HflC (stomatin/prohibitin superfamily)